jgi:hypothetical protein
LHRGDAAIRLTISGFLFCRLTDRSAPLQKMPAECETSDRNSNEQLR